MATFKAIIRADRKRTDGTYNVKIRVVHNREVRNISTLVYVSKEDITKSLKIKNQSIVDVLDDLIRQYRNVCNQQGARLEAMSIAQVVQMLTKPKTGVFELDFIAYGRSVADKLRKSGHIGTGNNYDIALNSLIKYLGCDNLDVLEVTGRLVQDFAEWIVAQPARNGRKKGDRAASLYLGIIRAIHNRAKNEHNDEDLGVVNIPISPFKRFKIPKSPPTRKRAVEIDTIRQIMQLPDKEQLAHGTNRYNMARDVFILSFGLIGMNSADLYFCTKMKSGRITYNREKTKTRRVDRAEISIKIEPEIMALVEKYRDPTKDRVFSFYRMYSGIGTFSSAINKGLKKIGKDVGVEDLEFYAARHSWATIARSDAGIEKATIHEALNHASDLSVTDIYIRKDWSLIDKANRAVLDLLK